MTSDEVAKFLIGKKIIKIDYRVEFRHPMCIDQIYFDDGSSVDLYGQSDNCIAEYLYINNEQIKINMKCPDCGNEMMQEDYDWRCLICKL